MSFSRIAFPNRGNGVYSNGKAPFQLKAEKWRTAVAAIIVEAPSRRLGIQKSLMGHKDLKTTMRYIRAVQLQRNVRPKILSTNRRHKRCGRQR